MTDLSMSDNFGGGRYPARRRQTVQEAEDERLLRRRQEAADRERQKAERQAIVRRAQQERLDQPPTTAADRSELDDIAYNIHTAYNWDGREDQCVTAVLRFEDRTYGVYPQRFMKVMQEYAAKHYSRLRITWNAGGGSHLHAEMYAMYALLVSGKVPSEVVAEIGVSKEICPLCRDVLDYLGIVYNTAWVTDAASSNWVDPWSLVPKDKASVVKVPPPPRR